MISLLDVGDFFPDHMIGKDPNQDEPAHNRNGSNNFHQHCRRDMKKFAQCFHLCFPYFETAAMIQTEDILDRTPPFRNRGEEPKKRGQVPFCTNAHMGIFKKKKDT
jgi:hypothetical protein